MFADIEIQNMKVGGETQDIDCIFRTCEIQVFCLAGRNVTGLSNPVKYFTDHSKAVLLWISYVFFRLLLLCLCGRLFICALSSPAGKGLTSWLSFVVSTVSLSLSH